MLIVWTNSKNEQIVLPQENKYILNSWSGFSSIAQTLNTEKAPGQFGSSIINQSFENRALNIQFTLLGNNRQRVFEVRREVINLFNPTKKKGMLTWVQNEGIEYSIECYVENLEMPSGDGRGNTFQDIQLDFLAEDPRWFQSEIIEGLSIGNNLIVNNGDTETALEIRFKGPMTNPVLKNNNTGEKIQIVKDISAQEEVVVKTNFGKKEIVLINDDNSRSRAMNLMSYDSNLFSLQSDNTLLEFEANNMTAESLAEIKYRERFIGV